LFVINPLVHFTRWAKSDVAGSVSPATFSKVLQRERMRADRCARPFCVLIFTASPAKPRRRDRKALSQYLLDRLRKTDVVGQLRDGEQAAILFNTPHDGAQSVLRTIQHDCLIARTHFSATIHAYPAVDASHGAEGMANERTTT